MTRVTQSWPLHARFEGPIVMIGFGSIGRGTLPLIERHIAFDRSKFVVMAPDDENQHLLEERQQARARRDFATADALRDRLLAAGIAVEDTPDGPMWTLKDS